MISKASTKNFTEKPNAATLKSDGANTLSARDKEKLLGDENVGDYLNKIADPKWIDPAKRITSAPKNELGKDAFMKLMLQQMKNQDPTNPLKSHEMAAQLAQFTSLEQLSNINTNLEELRQSQAPSNNFQALTFIGKKVSGDASKIIRSEGDKQHEIRFDLKGNAKEIDVTITDLNGNILKTIELKDPKKGENQVEWDGVAENGQVTRSGEYRVKIEAKGESGRKVHVDTKFEGNVTGVNFTAEGPVLLVGNKSVRLSEIKRIENSPDGASVDKKELPKVDATKASPANGEVGKAEAAKNDEAQKLAALSKLEKIRQDVEDKENKELTTKKN